MPMAKQANEPRAVEYHRGHLATCVDVISGCAESADGAGSSIPIRGMPRSLLSSAAALLRAAFLPEGFPDCVSPDYLGFQTWDTIQALCSYVRGVLTSQAILRGVGVGQEASTPLAAVFTFFVRDLAGMLGGILFAYLEGSSFDSCAKQWRLFADITNDLGMTVELASPFFPRAMFLPIACIGSIARSLTGVAGGATRAALTQHFARRGNAADVSAKEQSQETATTIVGMVAGMVVTRFLASGESATAPSAAAAASSPASSSSAVLWAWAVFATLTALHVVANVAAMRVLLLTSLNAPRLELLLHRYLREGQVLSPQDVAGCEDLTPPPFRRLWDGLTGASRRQRVRLHYGSRLSAALRAAAGAAADSGGTAPAGEASARDQRPTGPHWRIAACLEALLQRQGDRPYLLLATASSCCSPLSPPPPPRAAGATAGSARLDVHLVLRRDASSAEEQLRAFVHSHCLAHFCAAALTRGGEASSGAGVVTPPPPPQEKPEERAAPPRGGALAAAAEAAAEEWMSSRYDDLISVLRNAGWRTDRVALPRPSWTAEWGCAAGGGLGAAGEKGARGERGGSVWEGSMIGDVDQGQGCGGHLHQD